MRFFKGRQKLFMLICLTILTLSVIFMQGCGERNSEKGIAEGIDSHDDSSNANLSNPVGSDIYFTGNYNYFTCTQESEFYEMIDDNPIDKVIVMGSDDANMERIEKAAQYQKAWEQEIQYTLNILKQYLDEDDYEKICAAYQNWESYIDNLQSIETGIFYPSGKYRIGSGMSYPMPMEAKAARIKHFALILMSWEYEFTGNVEFAFSEGEMLSLAF